VIIAEGLTRRFADLVAVDDVSFTLPKGCVTAFLGPNGAGKTTTLRMITGSLSPSAGRVLIAGHDSFEAPYKARQKVGYLPERPPLYPELRVREQLRFVAALKGVNAQAVTAVVEEVELGTVLSQVQGQLSKGFRQRVGLACALLGNPELLILDEPTSGLDPQQIEMIRGLIRRSSGHRTVLLSTHILGEVDAVCDHVLMIAEGRLVADAPRTELVADADGSLAQAFLARCGLAGEDL
jgi:ABC-2 type transport system ATP-binding protein